MENHVQVPKSSEDVSSLSGRLVLFRTIICCMDTGQTYEPKKVDDTQSAKENMWVPQIMTVFFHVSSWSMTTQILMFGGFVYGFTTYPTKSCQHLAGSQQSTNNNHHIFAMLKRSTRRFVVLTLLALWGASHDRLSFTPLLVVLDLDETLLHASLLKDDSWKWLKNPRLWQPASIDFEAKGKGLVLGLEEEIPLFVSLRPGAKEFLSWLKKQKAMEAMEIAVYTAGTQQYASQSVELLGALAAEETFWDFGSKI